MIAVLFSGGVDSYIHLQWAMEKYGADAVEPVFFDVGQAYFAREYRAFMELTKNPRPSDDAQGQFLSVHSWAIESFTARLVRSRGEEHPARSLYCKKLKLHEDSEGHVPLRNLSFILELAKSTEYTAVVFGMLKGESPEDKNPSFVKQVQQLLDDQFAPNEYRKVRREFKILTPFAEFTKADMIQWYISKGYDTTQLYKTVACLRRDGSCGACMSCFNRWVAWEYCGLDDETYKWEQHPGRWMVSRLREVKRGAHGWGFLRSVWVRRKWLYQTYCVMHSYTKRVCGKHLLRMIF